LPYWSDIDTLDINSCTSGCKKLMYQQDVFTDAF
jgi:hypothetical protein